MLAALEDSAPDALAAVEDMVPLMDDTVALASETAMDAAVYAYWDVFLAYAADFMAVYGADLLVLLFV